VASNDTLTIGDRTQTNRPTHPPTRSLSLSDLEWRRISSPSEHETLLSQEYSNPKNAMIRISHYADRTLSPSPGSCSDMAVSPNTNNKQKRILLAPEPNQRTGRRSPPPPPLEHSSVQHPYTRPGAISIRPASGFAEEAQIAASGPISLAPTDFSEFAPPIEAFHGSGPHRSSSQFPSSPHSQEILIEARLVEEETSMIRETRPVPDREQSTRQLVPLGFSGDGSSEPIHAATIQTAPAKNVYFDEYIHRDDHASRCCRQQRRYLHSHRTVLFGLLTITLLGAIGLVLGLWLRGNGKAQPSRDGSANWTRPPEGFSPEAFIEFELPPYSREAVMTSSQTPQSKALEFLAQDPQIETYSKSRRLTRFALATFFFSSSLGPGPVYRHGNVRDWWLTNASECDWFSNVMNEPSCNQEGQFTVLQLEENQLGGTLPAEMGLLADLEQLDLAQNFLRGTLPSEIGAVTTMNRLDLSQNKLFGTVPLTLCNMSSLVHVDLWDNYFSGTIPSFLFHGLADGMDGNRAPMSLGNGLNRRQETKLHPLVEYIDLGYNVFTGTIPYGIGMSRNLRELSLRQNYLEGSIPASLYNVTTLSYFGKILVW
jgi:hypothetical protein